MSINTEIKRIYEVQSNPKNVLALRNSSYQDRIAKIKSIYNYILNQSDHNRIAEALYKDLRKGTAYFFSKKIPLATTKAAAEISKFKFLKRETIPNAKIAEEYIRETFL